MQREYVGRGQVSSFIFELNNASPKSILLVTGKNSFESCGAKKILMPFLANYKFVEFNDFSPNPTYVDAMKGVDVCEIYGVDMVIAVGGGSCIDIAKSINALYTHKGEELALVRGETKIYKRLMPLIAIPTTAGTGSEATHFSVIYLDGEKYSLASPELIPDAAIVDPVFTDSLSPYITASTGFDALCQSIESYWAESATNESKEYAKSAIPQLIRYLPEAVKLGTNEAREQVMVAANFAGKAINISKTTAPHALSYGLTSLYGLPHGHAVALTLGVFFILHNQVVDRVPGNKRLQDNMRDLYELLEVANANQAHDLWYQLMNDCGLETNLKEVGVRQNDVKKIVAGINIERLKNHPIDLSPELLINTFNCLLAGETI